MWQVLFPRFITVRAQVNKQTMKSEATTILMPGGDDVRYLQQDGHNHKIFYAATNTAPGQLIKIDKTSMSRVDAVIFDKGACLPSIYASDSAFCKYNRIAGQNFQLRYRRFYPFNQRNRNPSRGLK